MASDTFQRVQISAAQELWDWLEGNHAQTDSVWLVTWKAAHPEHYVSRDEVLDALIAYGWIDGRRMALDASRTMQLISPRKQHAWAETYKKRAEKLEAQGRMMGPGRAKLTASRQAGQWNASQQIDRLELPDDLLQALHSQDALNWWEAAAPSYRRNVLRWIETAKKPETRRKRIETVSMRAGKGEKVPNY